MLAEDSDEVTSAENTTCCECFNYFEEPCRKKEGFQDSLCEKCTELVKELEKTLKIRIDQIQEENSELNAKSMEKMQELHNLRKTVAGQVKNFSKIEDLNRKARLLKRDFSDTFSILLLKEKEKFNASQKLNEKQCEFEKLTEKIKSLQISLKSPADDVGTLEDLRQENSKLLDQVKDKEINQFLEVKSTSEALSTLKNQLLREKRMGFRTFSGEIRNLQLLTEIEKSLLEELQEVKRKIDTL